MATSAQMRRFGLLASLLRGRDISIPDDPAVITELAELRERRHQ